MRGNLARDILSADVANALRQKAKEQGKTCWNGLIEFIEQCDSWWNRLGSGWAPTYTSADDPRLRELYTIVAWFSEWESDVNNIKLGAEPFKLSSVSERNRMFISQKTMWALRQTTFAFVGLCEEYLPWAPPDRGIRCVRCSQDYCEAYFVSCCLRLKHPALFVCLQRI